MSSDIQFGDNVIFYNDIHGYIGVGEFKYTLNQTAAQVFTVEARNGSGNIPAIQKLISPLNSQQFYLRDSQTRNYALTTTTRNACGNANVEAIIPYSSTGTFFVFENMEGEGKSSIENGEKIYIRDNSGNANINYLGACTSNSVNGFVLSSKLSQDTYSTPVAFNVIRVSFSSCTSNNCDYSVPCTAEEKVCPSNSSCNHLNICDWTCKIPNTYNPGNSAGACCTNISYDNTCVSCIPLDGSGTDETCCSLYALEGVCSCVDNGTIPYQSRVESCCGLAITNNVCGSCAGVSSTCKKTSDCCPNLNLECTGVVDAMTCTVKQLLANGQPCNSNSQCTSTYCDLTLQNPVCVSTSSPLCIVDADCDIGKYCNSNSKRCTDQQAGGNKCTRAEECASSNCKNGTCTAENKLWIYLIIGGVIVIIIILLYVALRKKDTVKKVKQ
jgi:hypothetical protein